MTWRNSWRKHSLPRAMASRPLGYDLMIGRPWGLRMRNGGTVWCSG